jgi:hypothetical protein
LVFGQLFDQVLCGQFGGTGTYCSGGGITAIDAGANGAQ